MPFISWGWGLRKVSYAIFNSLNIPLVGNLHSFPRGTPACFFAIARILAMQVTRLQYMYIVQCTYIHPAPFSVAFTYVHNTFVRQARALISKVAGRGVLSVWRYFKGRVLFTRRGFLDRHRVWASAVLCHSFCLP